MFICIKNSFLLFIDICAGWRIHELTFFYFYFFRMDFFTYLNAVDCTNIFRPMYKKEKNILTQIECHDACIILHL